MQAIDINTAPSLIRTTNPLMALSGCMGHGLQHVLSRLPMPITQMVSEDITKALVSGTDYKHSHGSQAS